MASLTGAPAESRGHLVAMGLIQTKAGRPLAERLNDIFTRLSELIEENHPDVVAIEELFFAKNVKTAMVVAHGRAAAVLATARRRVTLCEYTPPPDQAGPDRPRPRL